MSDEARRALTPRPRHRRRRPGLVVSDVSLERDVEGELTAV
jgi:hypothetical protein